MYKNKEIIKGIIHKVKEIINYENKLGILDVQQRLILLYIALQGSLSLKLSQNHKKGANHKCQL